MYRAVFRPQGASRDNYDRTERLDGENKTIGILLCQEKNDAVVELTLPEDNDQIFASQYLVVLPSKEELKRLMSEVRDNSIAEEAK